MRLIMMVVMRVTVITDLKSRICTYLDVNERTCYLNTLTTAW